MQDILLLHGALGAASTLEGLAAELEQAGYRPHLLNFAGHGGAPFGDAFGIEAFASELQNWLDQHAASLPIPVFGYSMGGYVALYAAQQRPGQISQIMTLGTKFDWTAEGAAREVKMLNPDKIEEKVPRFAQLLAQRHAPQDWKALMQSTAGMMISLGNAPLLQAQTLATIEIPVLIGRGAADDMVSEAESKDAASALGQGQYQELADTPHPIEKVDAAVLAQAITAFLS